MNQQKALYLLSGFSVVCLLALVILGFNTWKLSSKVEELTSDRVSDLTTSSDPADFWSQSMDPFEHFNQLHKRMNSIWGGLSSHSTILNQGGLGLNFTSPTMSMNDKSDHYEITVQIPEGQNVNVETKLSGNQLTVSGKVNNEVEDSQQNQITRMIQSSQFSQSFYLSEPIDESGLQIKPDEKRITIIVPKTG